MVRRRETLQLRRTSVLLPLWPSLPDSTPTTPRTTLLPNHANGLVVQSSPSPPPYSRAPTASPSPRSLLAAATSAAPKRSVSSTTSATMICVDNSEWMWNSDYPPFWFQA